MSDSNLDLIKLFVLGERRYYSREEIEAAIPNAREVTRRLRELREERYGCYNIRHDGKKGYIYAPDESAVIGESLQRRRKYLLEQCVLP